MTRRKQKSQFLFGALLILLSDFVLSAQTELVTVISVDMKDGIFDDKVEISIDSEPCTQPLKFVLNDKLDELMLTILMTAKSTGQKVQITYDDTAAPECIIRSVAME